MTRIGSRSRALGVVSTVLALVVIAGCDPTPEPGDGVVRETVEISSDLSGELFAPASGDPTAILVMVPGGAWLTADPTGLHPLAEHLADVGITVLAARVRAAEDGVTYPTPVSDVVCALAYVAAREGGDETDPVPTVVLGHSSGAHLAALAALTPDVAEECTDPIVTPDGLVGLAGPYDVSAIPDLAHPFFGTDPEEDPETWRRGNPLRVSASMPQLPVLLVHGESDDVVPASFTREFALALESGGHQVATTMIPGADHVSIYTPEVVGEIVTEWVRELERLNG